MTVVVASEIVIGPTHVVGVLQRSQVKGGCRPALFSSFTGAFSTTTATGRLENQTGARAHYSIETQNLVRI